MRTIFFSLFLLLSITLLVGLGTWQVQRLGWKTDIISRLEAARATPQKLRFDDLQALSGEELPLAYGSVTGRLLSDKEILVGPKAGEGQNQGQIGYSLITPLEIPGGTILVNRGWVHERFKEEKNRKNLRAKGSITFTGLVRKPDWNRFTSNNSPENDLWFKIDPYQIAKAKGLKNVSALVLYAESSSRKFEGQNLNPPGWLPRNEHRQYAIFWFTMAAIFSGFFGFFIWRQKKKTS